MPILTMPDGIDVDFPDDMPKEKIKSLILSKYPDAFKTQQPALKLSEEQKEQIAANNRAYEEKQENNLLGKVLNNPIVRAQAAATQGIANASLNPFGYVARALGFDTKPLEPETATERALEKAGEYGFDAATLAAGGAGLKGAGLLGQGVGKTSKIARALLAPEAGEAIAGAASGGALEGLAAPESTAGKIAANLAGGIAGGGIYGLFKAPTTKAMRSGLENVVNDTDALKIVRRGAKIDDDIAENVIEQAAGAAENINQKSVNELDRVLNGVDPQARYKDVRASYQKFVNENQGKKIKGNWKNLPKLNDFQKDEYEKALREGFRKSDYGTKEGDLGHLLTARGQIDDAINRSYIQEFPGKKATLDTAKLTELRKKLDNVLGKDSGIKGQDRLFGLYRAFDDAYQTGLKFTPGNRKNVLNDLMLEAGGDAEKALQSRIGMRKGLYDALTNNVVPEQNFSKQAKQYQNILKKLEYGENKLIKDLTKNERDYARLAKLTNTAENKLTTPEATRFFGREQLESKGAGIGAAIDTVLGRLNRDFYKQNANKLLQGGGEMVDVLTDPVYLQRAQNLLKGGATGGIREGELLYLKNLLDAYRKEQ